jgi:DNA-binding transcriptional MocR family regulator
VYGSDSGFVRFTFARPKPEEIASGISKFAEALRALIDERHGPDNAL